MTNEATRAYVYRIALAALVLLAVYGVVDRDLLEQWNDLLVALLGVGAAGLAAKHTSTQ